MKKILLVEDNALIAMAEAAVLRNNGYEVLTANTGEESLKVMGEDPLISLILMDIDLGRGMDGTEAAALILSTHEIPIVFLTSHSEKEYVERVRKITGYGYVLKNSGEFVLIESIKMAYTLFEAKQNIKKQARNLQKAELRSEKHRRYLKATLESVPTAIITADHDSRVVEWNREAEKLFGYTTADAEGKKVDELITSPASKEREEAEEVTKFVLAKGKIRGQDVVRYGKDGTPIHLSLSVAPIIEDDKLTGAVASYKEIAENGESMDSSEKEGTTGSERKIKASEARYRSLFYETPLGTFQYDQDGVITECNEKFVHIIGTSRENLIGLDMIGQLKDKKLIEELQESLLKGKGYYEGDYTSVTAEKTTTVRVFFKGLKDEKGEIYSGMGLVEDITDRKRAENALKREQHFFQSIMDALPDTVYFKDNQHRFLRVNRAKAREADSKPEQLIGKTDFDYFSEETARRCRKDDEYVLRTGNSILRKEEIIHLKHKEKTVVASKFLLKDEKGNNIGTMGLSWDISERKQMEKELRRAVEEKGFLMKELNHRVKNNLAIITSLLRMKNSKTGDSIDLSDIISQIDAIRLVHEKLHQRDEIETIELREYFRDLLETIFISFSERYVKLQDTMDEVFIDTKSSIALGLIVNELAINAIKHGFTETLDAIFTVDMKEENGEYVLTLSNTGKPFPEDIDPATTRTLGLELVSSLVAQLKGSLELRKKPYPVYTIRFPS